MLIHPSQSVTPVEKNNMKIFIQKYIEMFKFFSMNASETSNPSTLLLNNVEMQEISFFHDPETGYNKPYPYCAVIFVNSRNNGPWNSV